LAARVNNPTKNSEGSTGTRQVTEGVTSKTPNTRQSPATARYTFGAHLRAQAVHICIFAACIFGVCLIARVMKVSWQGTATMAALCTFGLAVSLIFEFARHKKFYQQAANFEDAATEFSELDAFVTPPTNLTDTLSYDLASSVKALANTQVTDAKHELHNYREYIELWIHEAKTPIAAAKLALANNPGAQNDTVALELEAIERAVEQALFYARSADVSRDFAISPQNVAALVRNACKQNSRLLIEAGVTPIFEIENNATVLTDPIWMTFILGQVISNSAKYGATQIRFTTQPITNAQQQMLSSNVNSASFPAAKTNAQPGNYSQVAPVLPNTPSSKPEKLQLLIADNGCGISAQDLPRVFDRGFTGNNGRNHARSTGMGLYLVARLCQQMGAQASITSAASDTFATTLTLAFPCKR
jgi:signal transduction histidine kinase